MSSFDPNVYRFSEESTTSMQPAHLQSRFSDRYSLAGPQKWLSPNRNKRLILTITPRTQLVAAGPAAPQ
jgi:hypothetical protein